MNDLHTHTHSFRFKRTIWERPVVQTANWIECTVHTQCTSNWNDKNVNDKVWHSTLCLYVCNLIFYLNIMCRPHTELLIVKCDKKISGNRWKERSLFISRKKYTYTAISFAAPKRFCCNWRWSWPVVYGHATSMQIPAGRYFSLLFQPQNETVTHFIGF